MLLPSRHDVLTRWIREDVRLHGPVPFDRFMRLALYCPELGYYDPNRNSVGRAGDFYTNVSVGPLFGELLAFQFAPWLDAQPGDCAHLVEAGAHEGTLARDILRWLQQHRPTTWQHLEYWIVEPSPRRQARQEMQLKEFAGRVHWLDSWEASPPFRFQGVIFSNELLDAMPVHRLGWDSGLRRWFEWGVDWEDDRFVWRRLPAPHGVGSGEASTSDGVMCSAAVNRSASPRPPFGHPLPIRWGEGGVRGWASWEDLLPEVPPALAEVLPDGFATEIGTAAVQWWKGAASRLGRGRLLTFDYGLAAEEFLLPVRSAGTLRAYRRHCLSADVLDAPGEQDLTAHVNFTAVARAGEAAGLRTDRLCAQTGFLTGIARATWDPGSGFGAWTADRVRQFHTLTHPEHLGRSFKVLLQSR
jgi:SAM-dependent MidA family methyltransferase